MDSSIGCAEGSKNGVSDTGLGVARAVGPLDALSVGVSVALAGEPKVGFVVAGLEGFQVGWPCVEERDGEEEVRMMVDGKWERVPGSMPHGAECITDGAPDEEGSLDGFVDIDGIIDGHADGIPDTEGMLDGPKGGQLLCTTLGCDVGVQVGTNDGFPDCSNDNETEGA